VQSAPFATRDAGADGAPGLTAGLQTQPAAEMSSPTGGD